MASIRTNQLYTRSARHQLSKAFGIKIAPSPAIVHMAKNAGFDCLFVDLEHTTMSIHDAHLLCTTALAIDITPLVRVPYQCGDGFVQRVLDGGAMGVVFPHIRNKVDAQSAVRVCKFPPSGTRSLTGQLPHFSFTSPPPKIMMQQLDESGSAVVLMIETCSAIDNIDDIASVPGVDALLVGSNDLSVELGSPGDYQSGCFQQALEKVSSACKNHKKTMGVAGTYNSPAVIEWAVKKLGVGLVIGHQDVGLFMKGLRECVAALEKLDRDSPE